MDILELNGEWTTQVELSQLAKLRNLKFFGYDNSRQHLATLEKGLITINFSDEHNLHPDPSIEQTITFNFIKDNQNAILETLFDGLKNKIYPKYQEQVDVDDYNFPPLNNLNDLELVLGIHGIAILSNYNEGSAYYEIGFAFSGDSEHGIIISMHQLRIIGFCGMGDNDGRAVLENMGYDYDKWLQEYLDNIDNSQKKDFYVHQKIPKYNKLKPWQKEENWTYLLKLIRANDTEKLNLLIKHKEIDIEEKYSTGKTILCTAVSMNNKFMVQFFLEKGASVGNAILECSQGDRFLKVEVLQLLVQFGGNVDYLGYWKRTTLYYEISNWVNTYQNITIEERKQNPDRLEKYKIEFENHTKNIIFLIKLGANPLNCDGENSTYFTLLKERWREEYITQTGIEYFINKQLH